MKNTEDLLIDFIDIFNLRNEFFNEYAISDLNLTDDTEFYEKDDSDYNCIDGEEGDYGTIKYYYISPINGKCLIATFINRGGDDADYEFTEYSFNHFKPYLTLLFEKGLTKLKNEYL